MRTVLLGGLLAGGSVMVSGQPASAPAAQPWSMAADKVERAGDIIDATRVSIAIGSTCGQFAGTSVLTADKAVIARGSTPPSRVMELSGNVRLRYTLLHD